MKTKKPQLAVDDLARVRLVNGMAGDVVYMVTSLGERGRCTIRESGNPRAGMQPFDVSLLIKVDRDTLKPVR